MSSPISIPTVKSDEPGPTSHRQKVLNTCSIFQPTKLKQSAADNVSQRPSISALHNQTRNTNGPNLRKQQPQVKFPKGLVLKSPSETQDKQGSLHSRVDATPATLSQNKYGLQAANNKTATGRNKHRSVLPSDAATNERQPQFNATNPKVQTSSVQSPPWLPQRNKHALDTNMQETVVKDEMHNSSKSSASNKSPNVVISSSIMDNSPPIASSAVPGLSGSQPDPPTRKTSRRRTRNRDSLSQTFKNQYELLDNPEALLGAGAYGTVMIARRKKDNKNYAAKIINKTDKNTREKCFNELRILKCCKHEENILQMYEFHEDNQNYYMVNEYVEGGNLQDHFDKRGCFTDYEVAGLAKDLATALDFLHRNHIAHRDLKPANILCVNKDSITPCKIADFDLANADHLINNSNSSAAYDTQSAYDSGYNGHSPSGATPPGSGQTDRYGHSRYHHKGSEWNQNGYKSQRNYSSSDTANASPYHNGQYLPSRHGASSPRRGLPVPLMEMVSAVGSPEYMAPEVASLFMFDDDMGHKPKYTQACDVWSAGVILYKALSGQVPFKAKSCQKHDCRWEEGEGCRACQDSLFDEIYQADLQFRDKIWEKVSEQAKHLVCRCLARDPYERITAAEMLCHPFITALTENDHDLNMTYNKNEQKPFSLFQPSSDLEHYNKGLVKPSETISNYNNNFNKPDTHSGVINIMPTVEPIPEDKPMRFSGVYSENVDRMYDHYGNYPEFDNYADNRYANLNCTVFSEKSVSIEAKTKSQNLSQIFLQKMQLEQYSLTLDEKQQLHMVEFPETIAMLEDNDSGCGNSKERDHNHFYTANNTTYSRYIQNEYMSRRNYNQCDSIGLE